MEITPLLLLCGVSACSLDESSHNTTLLELFGGRRKKSTTSLLLLLVWCLKLAGVQPFAWASRGVYIGLPPGGTMVIRLGAGARRLVGPAGCRPLGRQAGPTVQGLVGGWLLWLHLVDVSFIMVSVATVPPPVRRSL